MEDQKIVVYVSGGNVQAIYSSNPNAIVKVIDDDNMIAEGKLDEERQEILNKEIEGLEVVY